MKRLLLLFSVAALLLSGCAGLGKDEWTPVKLPKSLEKQWLAFDYFKDIDVYLMDFTAVKGKVCFVPTTHELYNSGKFGYKFSLNSNLLYPFTCEKKGKDYRIVFTSGTQYYFSDITATTATFRVDGEENRSTTIKVADPPIKFIIID